jgi:hypothetical protein
LISDTTPEAESYQHQIFARMTGDERVCAAMALSDQMRDIALAGFRNRHPQWGEKEIMEIFIKEIHGIEIKGKVGKAPYGNPD